MQNPNISVIIPVYNGEQYLKETVESVLAQTYKNFEIIIIDDGSTDSSPQIIKSLIKKYPKKIKAIWHNKNKGCPAATRNTGIKNAKGKYIAFLDQDDLWLPEKLKKQIKVIDSSPAISMVATNSFVFDQKKKKIIGKSWSSVEKFNRISLTRRLLKQNIIPTGSVALIKKEFFEKYGLLDERFKIADDYDLWFRISRYYQIKLIDEPLVIWRRTGATTSVSEKNLLNDFVYFFEKRKKEGFVSSNLGLYYFRVGNSRLSNKKFEDAKKYYQIAEKEGYQNFKIKMIKFLLRLSPYLASFLIKIKRNISLKLTSPVPFLEIDK